MVKIAVIGAGYVGLVSGICFADVGNQIVCADIDADKIAKLSKGEIPIYEPGLADLAKRNASAGRLSFTTDVGEAIRQAEVVYIAVGTPMSENGAADLTYVKETAETIGRHLNNYKIIVTKSTVPVGTGKRIEQWIGEHRPDASVPFDVASNPEFLREGSAIRDCMQMERAVIGARSKRAVDVLRKLHEPFQTKVIVTDIESAEMIKYAANAFLATKISFINSIANLCERVGADISKVSEGMGADSRIGGKFLQAGIGYGGSCFPKDTEALRHIAQTMDCEFPILDAVIETNQKQRFVVIDKLTQALGSLQGKRIGVLGLSFKPETDDIRYSPALDIIPTLVSRGAEVIGCDPIATEAVCRTLGDFGIAYTENWQEAALNSDACVILTEWREFRNMDLAALGRMMRCPILVDGRNCFDMESMRRNGFEYHSVGRRAVHAPEPVGATSVS